MNLSINSDYTDNIKGVHNQLQMSKKEDITLLLKRAGDDEDVYDQVYPLVYQQLRDIASARINREGEDHTYSKTELVHETYLKMVNQSDMDYQNRSHFLAICSSCMRQILIDYARKKKAQKRGRDYEKYTYVDGLIETEEQDLQELIDIDDAMKRLEELNPRLTKVVEMRFFGGMKVEEVAEVLGVSESTVHRDWLKARGWLYQELKGLKGE